MFEPLLRDQPHAPVASARSSGWMLASLFGLGAALAGVAATSAVPPAGSARSLLFAVALAVAAGTSGGQTIRLDQRSLQPAPTLVFVVCAATLFGPAGAVLVAVAAALASSWRSPTPAIVVHAGLGVLAGASTGLVAHEVASGLPAGGITILSALVAMTGTAVWALGALLVAAVRRTGRSHRTLSLVAESTELLVAAAFSPGLVLCYRDAGLMPAVVLAGALVALSIAFRLYRERLLDLHAQLLRLSRTDPLTGCANRRAFDELLQQEVARAGRTEPQVGLLLIDVDHFKQINDTHGHDTGDRVLRDVCRCLTARLRLEDRLARVGGDEFAAIITNLTTNNDLQATADALCEAAHGVARAREHGGPEVTVSIGGATTASWHDVDSLRRAADEALYAAKAQGRNCGVVHTTRHDLTPALSAPCRDSPPDGFRTATMPS